MRIAIVHSVYSSRQPSGENRVVEDQVAALDAAGHEVLPILRRTDDLSESASYPLRAAKWTATGRGPDPLHELTRFQPDVVHIHNLFPNFGTQWLRAWVGPIVATLHNYRAVCANGLLYRDDAVCHECPDGSRWGAVRHACYRGSRLASLPPALGTPKRGRAVLDRADEVVTLSPGADRLMRSMISPLPRTTVVPNFVAHAEESLRAPADQGGDTWVAVGRFTPEKGLVDLVRSWPLDERLVVIGDGPQRTLLENLAVGRPVHVRAGMAHDDLLAELPRFRGLIMPSLWHEVAPNVVSEALCAGVPVIAHSSNVVADLVVPEGLGAVYDDPASLADALSLVSAHRRDMSLRARAYAAGQFTEEAWLARMTSVYGRVLEARRSG
jgi:glycosyltransferase involved in cell wall biosynthesis